jgi:PAS domain S-box-containing protein
MCDRGDTFLNVDPAFAEIHGYAVSELIGQPVDVIVAPERRAEVPERLEDIRASGHLTFETLHVRKDGTRFPARVNVIVASDGASGAYVSAAIVEDLSAPEVHVNGPEPAPSRQAARERYRLTLREVEVLELVAAGKTDKEIAKTLGRSPYTVHNHVRHILLKMSATSRTDATVRALREGLV